MAGQCGCPGGAFRAHLVAITPTAFGKTEPLLLIIRGWIVDWKARSLPYVLFDSKSDPDVLRAVQGMCAHAPGARSRSSP